MQLSPEIARRAGVRSPTTWPPIGDEPGAENARARLLKASTRDPRLLAAGAALCENRIPEAEALLRKHLLEHPTDVAAIRMFAEVAARIGRYHDAENLLARCLELAPAFLGARHNYAVALYRQGKYAEALPRDRTPARRRAAQPELPQPARRGPGRDRRVRARTGYL